MILADHHETLGFGSGKERAAVQKFLMPWLLLLTAQCVYGESSSDPMASLAEALNCIESSRTKAVKPDVIVFDDVVRFDLVNVPQLFAELSSNTLSLQTFLECYLREIPSSRINVGKMRGKYRGKLISEKEYLKNLCDSESEEPVWNRGASGYGLYYFAIKNQKQENGTELIILVEQSFAIDKAEGLPDCYTLYGTNGARWYFIQINVSKHLPQAMLIKKFELMGL